MGSKHNHIYTGWVGRNSPCQQLQPQVQSALNQDISLLPIFILHSDDRQSLFLLLPRERPRAEVEHNDKQHQQVDGTKHAPPERH